MVVKGGIELQTLEMYPGKLFTACPSNESAMLRLFLVATWGEREFWNCLGPDTIVHL